MTGRDDETAQPEGLPRVITGPDGEDWIMAGYDEAEQLADLALMLTDVDQFLRTPGGHAALEAFYAARGSTGPGYQACLLTDGISFTGHWLRGRTRPHDPRS
jgi:hypothetical protein